MPVYAFEALNRSGATQSGVIEADSAKAARVQLRGQALVPLKVELVNAQTKTNSQSSVGSSRRARVFNATALNIWTRQLAGLVASGLPLERALSSLSEEAE